jgi:methylglutaconyl-CoA hydratase
MIKKYNTLKVSETSGVITISLDRPRQRNALDELMLTELLDILQWINAQKNYRAMILNGNGPVFCGGADLKWFMQGNDKSWEGLIRDSELFFDVYDTLYQLKFPTICTAHGAVYGGGNGLIAACDISIATEGTQFSFSEIRLGLVPATVSPFVINRIGPYKARELMLTGKSIDAKEAERIHLIDRLCIKEALNECLDEIINDIKQSAPKAVIETKKLLLGITRIATDSNLRSLTCKALADKRRSPEAKEGLSAFSGKRPPDWIK